MHVEPPPDRAIFLEAIESVPSEDWDTFLKERCAGDEQLFDRVRRLMRAHQRLGEFHEQSDLGHASDSETAETALLPSLGTRVGPYTLREQIGEGGMGVVYVAEQTEPVRRKVALKIIKPGMATKHVLARFEAERQALAMMDHSNIARVLDGGATDSGQPYFVMELVQGLPITEYCDARQLDTQQRLELFTKVCRAVHHSHQKGIIHRDLKPSNVLVPEIDGVAVPKVIDFGVAKAINQKFTEQTLYTNFSQMIGTPLYMSPEQAGLGVIDIDTRSDIYSLGVLLYELIAGGTPFDRETLRAAGFDEMRRIIREDQPPRPSTKVDTLNACSTFCQRREIDPRTLSKMLKGEIDWLVMKAMEKDRNRRYESASDLADDVDRYLRDEPIIARPMSRWYRVQKFTQRNRVLVASLAVVFVALSLGAMLATIGFLHALEQRDLARQALVEAEQARNATDKAFELLRNVIGNDWGTEGKLERRTVRAAMEQLEDGLSERLRDQPMVEIKIRKLFARHYRPSGEHDKARKHLNRALALAREVYPDNHKEVADIYVGLADELQWPASEAIDLDVYGFYAREAIKVYEAVGIRTDRTSHAWYCLSLSLTNPEERDDAEECLRNALRITDDLPVLDQDGQRVFARIDLANFLQDGDEADIKEACKYYNEALQMIRDHVYPGDRRTLEATVLSNRGGYYRRRGDAAHAIDDFHCAWTIFRQAEDLKDGLRGHKYALALAELHHINEQPTKADEVVAEVEQICTSENLPKSLAEISLFKGWRHSLDEDPVAAEQDFRDALGHVETSYPETHVMTAYCCFHLAEALRRQGKFDEARKYYHRHWLNARGYFELNRTPVTVLWAHAISLVYGEEHPETKALQDAFAAGERAFGNGPCLGKASLVSGDGNCQAQAWRRGSSS